MLAGYTQDEQPFLRVYGVAEDYQVQMSYRIAADALLTWQSLIHSMSQESSSMEISTRRLAYYKDIWPASKIYGCVL